MSEGWKHRGDLPFGPSPCSAHRNQGRVVLCLWAPHTPLLMTGIKGALILLRPWEGREALDRVSAHTPRPHALPTSQVRLRKGTTSALGTGKLHSQVRPLSGGELKGQKGAGQVHSAMAPSPGGGRRAGSGHWESVPSPWAPDKLSAADIYNCA